MDNLWELKHPMLCPVSSENGPMLCLTDVWHCLHLHENAYLMTCKNSKRLQNKEDCSIYATSAFFLPPRSHRSDGVIGLQEVCNPTSCLEEDCLQHQIRSAVALTTWSSTTPVEGDVTQPPGQPIPGLCYPPRAIFFFLNVQTESPSYARKDCFFQEKFTFFHGLFYWNQRKR